MSGQACLAALLLIATAAGIESAVAQSAPAVPTERQIFLPEQDAPAEASPAAAKRLAPASPKAARRRGAGGAAAARAPKAAIGRPAKPAIAKVPPARPTRKAEAARSADPPSEPVPLPRPAPEHVGAVYDAAAVPIPTPPPHRMVQAAPAPSGVPPQAEAADPTPSDAAMDVFAFVPQAPERPQAVPASPSLAATPPRAEAAVPLPAVPPQPAAEAAGNKSAARSVADVFLQIETKRAAGQIVLVPPATEPDARLLSPEPVLPPWRAAAAQLAKAAATPPSGAGATEPAATSAVATPPVAAMPEDPPEPSSTPSRADIGPTAPEVAPLPATNPAAAPPPAEPLAVPEPPPTAIPRYAAVPEPVRQLAESLPECTPDERGTLRQRFGDRVLFVISCLGKGQNQLRAFVLARKDDGEGANVLMFPRPGGGTGLPYMHQLSNPLVIGSRLEITHLSVDPGSTPCRTEGRWRVDPRGNAGLVSWRSASACSGDLVASATSGTPRKATAAASKGKSVKRPGRAGGKAKPARKSRRR